jgi:hypothetical protein
MRYSMLKEKKSKGQETGNRYPYAKLTNYYAPTLRRFSVSSFYRNHLSNGLTPVLVAATALVVTYWGGDVRMGASKSPRRRWRTTGQGSSSRKPIPFQPS